MMHHPARPQAPWRERMHEVIFGADTPFGRAFDIALLMAIGLSVPAVILESVAGIRLRYGTWLRAIEWTFTVLFTVEYLLRLLCVRRPLRYALSFFGVVDLLAIVPTYLSLVVTGAQSRAPHHARCSDRPSPPPPCCWATEWRSPLSPSDGLEVESALGRR